METMKRLGGTAGMLMVIAGCGVVYFMPDRSMWGWILTGAGLLPLIVATWLNRDDLLNLAKGRPFRHGANAIFYSVVVLGIVGAVDFLAVRHNHRFDLTETGRHSVSPQTVQILESLDKQGQEITLVGFFSPAQGPARQKAIDLMEEYRYHDARIEVKTLDPFRSPAEVKGYGVEEDGTVIVSSKTGEARISPSRDGGLTEENLTNAFIKATAKSKKVICVTTGHGERQIAQSAPEGFQQATEALQKENFDVREVKLLEGGGVPADCSSVVVPGATHTFLQPEVDALEKYLAGGGRALVLTEPRTPTGLETLLARYGLKTGNDFIVDVNPMAKLLGGSPAAPVVYEYGAHQITKDFEGLATIFPTVESVETTTPVEPDVTTLALAHTSAQSWGETGELADRVSFDAGKDKPGPLNIAALAVRKHAGATPPADPNAKDDAAGAQSVQDGGKETRLVLFGDSDYAANSAFMMAGNKDLFLNTIAWLNERTDLISIRPKTAAAQPVVMTGLQARLLKWYSLGLSPLIVVVIGVGVFLRRRRL
jgi:ABC-type uncharacterized transport system involved in gliding motility auxiliary subunit